MSCFFSISIFGIWASNKSAYRSRLLRIGRRQFPQHTRSSVLRILFIHISFNYLTVAGTINLLNIDLYCLLANKIQNSYKVYIGIFSFNSLFKLLSLYYDASLAKIEKKDMNPFLPCLIWCSAVSILHFGYFHFFGKTFNSMSTKTAVALVS